MQFMYDHLAASLLGIAVFLILVASHVRLDETSRDQTRYYSAKTHLLNATEMIEHDFEYIGAGVARNDSIFISKTDSTFEFMAKIQSEDAAPSKVTYRRVATEVVTIAGEAVQLYEVQRLVNDVLTGKAIPTMKQFEMELRDSNDAPVAAFDAVAAVHVRFVVWSPLGGEDELHEARWSRTFWPRNLSNF